MRQKHENHKITQRMYCTMMIDVKTKKTKYVVVPDHHSAAQNHNFNVSDTAFENYIKLQFL
jgi:hypothetical protein